MEVDEKTNNVIGCDSDKKGRLQQNIAELLECLPLSEIKQIYMRLMIHYFH